MFDLINGIPLHPLVVHAIVVLLPLAVIGTIVIAFVPRWRVRYGVLVVACTAAATVLLPVATSSGTALSGRVGNPGEHSELGDQLILGVGGIAVEDEAAERGAVVIADRHVERNRLLRRL